MYSIYLIYIKYSAKCLGIRANKMPIYSKNYLKKLIHYILFTYILSAIYFRTFLAVYKFYLVF